MRFVLILYFAIGSPNGTIEVRQPTMARCLEAGFDARVDFGDELLFWHCEERKP